jgi:hypothetical protein
MSGLHRRLLDGSTRQLSTVTANDQLMTETNNQCSVNPPPGGDSSPLSLSASSSLALRRPSTNMLVLIFYLFSYKPWCLV